MKHTNPYLSAQALGITEAEREALIWVYSSLKNRTIPAKLYDQGTSCSKRPCGTVACIGGWMAKYMGLDMDDYVDGYLGMKGAFGELFWGRPFKSPPQSGIQACLNTLTIGDPCWDELP